MAGLLKRLVRVLFEPPKTTSKPARSAATHDFARQNVRVIDRTRERERTQEKMAREDFLLNQIDEFREKAEKLQELLFSKENKVEELQGKATALQGLLEERQKQSKVVTDEMNQQIDKLISQVTDKVGVLEQSLAEKIADGCKLSDEQAAELKASLTEITAHLDTIKAELSDKIHSENVKCYRNTADLIKCMEDKLDHVTEVEKKSAKTHRCTVAILIFLILNFLGTAAIILNELGIIDKIMELF